MSAIRKKKVASSKKRRSGSRPPVSTKLSFALEGAVQTLAYWLGYQHARYPHHPLSEGAIVDEFTRLLSEQAPRPRTSTVAREYSIAKVAGNDKQGAKRFDIVVFSKGDHANAVATPEYCIEVKRAAKGYEADLVRLQEAASDASAPWRGFAVIVGNARPEFLNDKRQARRGTLPSSNGVSFAVRRVVRAHAAVTAEPKTGHWVCVLEVVRRTP